MVVSVPMGVSTGRPAVVTLFDKRRSVIGGVVMVLLDVAWNTSRLLLRSFATLVEAGPSQFIVVPSALRTVGARMALATCSEVFGSMAAPTTIGCAVGSL